jgi:Ca2+/Na+ antiporter
MVEKVYSTMKSVGIGNLVLGICIIILGIAAGVGIIINGAQLLKKKQDLLF